MMRSTSASVRGTGRLPVPTKPVTFGVFLTTCQAVSDISIFTSTYPGKNFRVERVFFPSLTSTTSSVGMRMSSMTSPIPRSSARWRRLSFTLPSKPEYV
jgi:hypothetical protein